MRFDGRTAIVTGAGGNPGLGRAYALLLAERGARLVVNDIGRDPTMPDDIAPASPESVVDEIRALGGEAIADRHSVATQAGADAIVAAALSAFGRIDILVNNAAISIAAPFERLRPLDFWRHIEVNLLGTAALCRAVWPHFQAQGYGRIVNTTSAAMTGFAHQSAYAASKGGIWSLTRALAVEGSPFGIKVNAISPGAHSRLVEAMLETDSPLLKTAREQLSPAACAPLVGLLAHADCPVSGECLDAVGGQFQRSVIARSRGLYDRSATMESLAASFDSILDLDDAETVGLASFDTADWKLRPYRPTD